MIRKLATFLTALWCASTASAQFWSTGPKAVKYPTSGFTYTGKLGNGLDAKGGVAPAVAAQAAEPVVNFTPSEWVEAAGAQRTALANPATQQAKFRIICGPSLAGRFDVILTPGQKNTGHDHTFLGLLDMNENKTTSTIVKSSTASATCPGGPMNRTPYWEPSVKKTLPSGAVVSIKPDGTIFYYSTVVGTDAAKFQPLIDNLAFIGGPPPHDPTDSIRKAEIPAGFSHITSGFHGWSCYDNSGTNGLLTDAGEGRADGFKTAAGLDPWGGRCTKDHKLYLVISAPECWDGENARSPNGRDHFRYKIRYGQTGAPVCPDGWYEVPVFESQTIYSLQKDAEYMDWHLSSDRMSADPAQWQRPGTTAHFDWGPNGWHKATLNTWLVRCIGMDVPGSGLVAQPADCNDGTINDGVRLKRGPSPDGLQAQIVDMSDRSVKPSKDRYFPIKSGGTHAVTGHSHGFLSMDASRTTPAKGNWLIGGLALLAVCLLILRLLVRPRGPSITSGIKSAIYVCARLRGGDFRRIADPTAPKPMSIIAQVAGSGTADASGVKS